MTEIGNFFNNKISKGRGEGHTVFPAFQVTLSNQITRFVKLKNNARDAFIKIGKIKYYILGNNIFSEDRN